MADTTLTVLSLSFRFCCLTLKVFVVRSCLFSVSLSLVCLSVSICLSLSVCLSVSHCVDQPVVVFLFFLTKRHEAVSVDTVQ